MSIAVLATFPDTDVTLKPSGSVIWWTKAHRTEMRSAERGRVRLCVPVTCGGCRQTRDVPVLNGLSREGLLLLDDLKLNVAGECAA